MGVQFIDGAVGFESDILFGNTLSPDKRCFSLIASAGINVTFFHIFFLYNAGTGGRVCRIILFSESDYIVLLVEFGVTCCYDQIVEVECNSYFPVLREIFPSTENFFFLSYTVDDYDTFFA